jgi:GIY-YIG domain-containing protein
MSKLTNWRKFADRRHWYAESFDYDGPACYELGLGGPRGGNIQPIYVGETANERNRITSYASHGSHIKDEIDKSLRAGYALYYRAQALTSKRAAKQMQNNMLEFFDYDWNIHYNL